MPARGVSAAASRWNPEGSSRRPGAAPGPARPFPPTAASRHLEPRGPHRKRPVAQETAESGLPAARPAASPEGPARLLPAALRPRPRGPLGTRWPPGRLHPEARPRRPRRQRDPARGTAASAGGAGREAGPGRRGETHPGPLEEGRARGEAFARGTVSRVGAPVPPTARALGGRPTPGDAVCPASSPAVAAPAPSRASRVHGSPLLSLLRLSPPLPPWDAHRPHPRPSLAAAAAPSLKGAGGDPGRGLPRPPEGLRVGTCHSSGFRTGLSEKPEKVSRTASP
ncbi:collagen alpha-1(I) chain-like [Pan troglodytes]|uniref:collagen alpha-1(I) chain-like n=1 Tax=Pan troglodytes TaxID=9598 RepID=UPI003013EA23